MTPSRPEGQAPRVRAAHAGRLRLDDLVPLHQTRSIERAGQNTPRRFSAIGVWASATARKPGTELTNQNRSRKPPRLGYPVFTREVPDGRKMLRRSGQECVSVQAPRGLRSLAHEGGKLVTGSSVHLVEEVANGGERLVAGGDLARNLGKAHASASPRDGGGTVSAT